MHFHFVLVHMGETQYSEQTFSKTVPENNHLVSKWKVAPILDRCSPYLTWRDVPLNRVFPYDSNYGKGILGEKKILAQGFLMMRGWCESISNCEPTLYGNPSLRMARVYYIPMGQVSRQLNGNSLPFLPVSLLLSNKHH